MEEGDDMFWLRPTTPRRRLRRSPSSILFSSGSFVILLLAVALAFIFVIIPSLHSLTSQIFRPNAVKKSWDSLNFLLVLFAILCGFLGRNTAANTDDDVSVGAAAATPVVDEIKSNIPSTPPRQWYEYSDRDRAAYRVSSMRSSSSYPDLRQQDSEWVARDDMWRRFHDDTHVRDYRAAPDSDHQVVKQHRRRASWHEYELSDAARTKNIPVDTFVIRTEQVPWSNPPMPDDSAPPPPAVRSPSPPRKSKRTYQAVPEKESSRNDDLDVPPREAAFPAAEVVIKRGKNIVKKKGVALATTKEFLITSIKGKKKKRRQVKSVVENFDKSASPSSYTTPLYPPPPPPPPPPSVFQNLFSTKKPKPKKTHHSVSQPPLSPPVTTSSATRLSKNKAEIRPTMTAQKPPLPAKVKSFNFVEEENQNSGGESPLMSRIPPPPPLPPFRMPETKYVVVHGDFVRIKSNNGSRSGSPDLSDGSEDSPTNETSSPLSGNESPARPMFCPSPDVNTKADTFIARFRAGLRLEKINSVRVRSNLGPDPSAEEEFGP